MTKEEIRSSLLRKRNQMTKGQVLIHSKQICHHIFNSGEFRQAKQLLFYYAIHQEVNLLPLAKEALSMGKQIAFPKVFDSEIVFCQVHQFDEFSPGIFRIMEPNIEKQIQWMDAIAYVPGVGFDRSYHRIGYGKGYYDRFFENNLKCRKVGVAFELQLVKELPTNKYDVPMDILVTENGFF